MRSQDEARRLTRLILCGFGLSIVFIVAVLYFLAVGIVVSAGAGGESGGASLWWRPELLLCLSLSVVTVIGGSCLYRVLEFRSGGGSVARSLRARRVFSCHADAAVLQYCNVVEEMSIACGVPIPEVYVIENEAGINAFAAGYQLHNAAIGLTRGALDGLSRDELQGVVAHEFSHILNGDMRLNLHLAAVIHGLFILSQLGVVLLGPQNEERVTGAGLAGLIFMFIMMAIGYVLIAAGAVGVLCGRLLQAAVSRQREYLADAAAVQFTRNPAGIAGALRRIAGLPPSREGQLQEPPARELAHMFFASCLADSGSRLFATHPPIAERIRRIEAGLN